MNQNERQKLRIEREYYDWWMNDNELTLNNADPAHPLVTYLNRLYGRKGWIWIVPKQTTK